ncbi:MAG: hypothetical protein ABI743_10555 [bacterium]
MTRIVLTAAFFAIILAGAASARPTNLGLNDDPCANPQGPSVNQVVYKEFDKDNNLNYEEDGDITTGEWSMRSTDAYMMSGGDEYYESDDDMDDEE